MASPDKARSTVRGRSHWSQWANWVAGAFAVVANVVGVVEIATTSRLLLSLFAGTLAMVAGGVWLWRLLAGGPSTRMRPLLVLNLLIMLIGAGLVGYVLAGPWPGDAQGQTPAAPRLPESGGPPAGVSPTNGSPTTSPPVSVTDDPGTTTTNQPGPAPGTTRPTTAPGGAPDTPPRAAPTTTTTSTRSTPNQPYTGTISIRDPQFGSNIAPGGYVAGAITAWTAGYQVWVSTREDGTTSEMVQGPCHVDGERFVCSNVQVAGGSGTKEWIRVAVVSDAVGNQLSGASRLPIESASAADHTLAHKG
jgi:hypothetical protein